VIVRFTDAAKNDLEAIGDRIAADNPERAATFVAEVRKACLGLAEFPKRFPVVPRYEGHGVHQRLHGNYLIFYRVEPGAVVILHVLHGAMDYAAILFPD